MLEKVCLAMRSMRPSKVIYGPFFWRYEVAPFAMISWTSGRHDFARLELRCDKVQDGKCVIEAKHVEIPERIGEFVADTHACGR